MWETIIGGLVVAAIVGLASAAYRTPRFYNERIFGWLWFASIAASAGLFLWDRAIDLVIGHIRNEMPIETYLRVLEKATELHVPSDWYAAPVGMLVLSFCLLLLSGAKLDYDRKHQ